MAQHFDLSGFFHRPGHFYVYNLLICSRMTSKIKPKSQIKDQPIWTLNVQYAVSETGFILFQLKYKYSNGKNGRLKYSMNIKAHRSRSSLGPIDKTRKKIYNQICYKSSIIMNIGRCHCVRLTVVKYHLRNRTKTGAT